VSGEEDATPDLSVTEAAELYDVSRRSLEYRVRAGDLPAYKARGAHGREWRVQRQDLEALGYRLSAINDEPPDQTVQLLRQTIERLRREVSHYRIKLAEADGELGHAAREMARLRADLQQARRPLEEVRLPEQPSLGIGSVRP